MMKKTILKCLALSCMLLGLAASVTPVFASGSDTIAWDKAPNKTNDLPALQNGAKLFVNYCLNCHSAAFMRYNRMKDLGLTETQIKDNLLFTGAKVGDTMVASIDAKQAKAWFGTTPPDLSLVARSRADASKGTGADYLYTYLRSYYRDSSTPTGWNNLAFPSVAMPHVLWELQGEREPVYEAIESHGHEVHAFKGWKQVSQGSMTPLEYDHAVGDLVGFMQWMAEPSQNKRVQVGVWVLFYFIIFVVIAWRLNAAYWKDVK